MDEPVISDPAALRNSNALCMMPWVSLHVAMNGNAYPCCFADGDHPAGSVRSQTVAEIWNAPPLRSLRRDMLAGRRSPVCAKCWEQEDNGFSSLRTSANANHAHHLPVIGETAEDGSVPRLNIVSLDVRFSNVCNFACRTCGSFASTAWRRYSDAGGNGVLRPRSSTDSLLREIEALADRLEHVYFSGGEPMLSREHYLLLEMLLERGREDVHLSYSTNYSTFALGRRNVIELWKRFPRVDVSASLDGSEAQGEYLRSGQRWREVLENRERQRRECPHVVFSVSSTLSLLNSLHLPDLHRELIELGFVEPDHIFINILQAPPHFRLTTLPPELKEKVRERYEQHVDYLCRASDGGPARRAYESAIRFMYSQDTTDQLDRFREVVRRQDGLRRESFAHVFPELAGLLA